MTIEVPRAMADAARCEDGGGDDGHDGGDGLVAADLAAHIGEERVRAMTVALARALVEQALADLGIVPPNENRS